MESKKINQLATELTPALSDLTIIGDPTTGISKKITLSQMASLFTGTVEEYANLAAFPLVGTADTIYIALDTNVLYRWDTTLTSYVELSPNIVTSLVFSDANGFDGNISLVGSVATLTITTALTQGSVAFIGASGALSQDNSNFFWDNTNKRLGINTNAPTTAIDAFGSGIIGRLNGTSTNNAFLGFASAGTNKWSIGNVQSDQRFRIYSETNTAELVSVLQTGEVGIGIANPTTKLHIDGGASALIANLDANVSVAKSISFRSDNSARINLEVSGTESGSDAGANFFLRAYSDAGALLNTPLTITRSTGNATFINNIAIAGVSLSAWGSTFGIMQSYYGSYFGGTSGGGTVMGNNNYFDGTNYKYVNTDYAGQIQIGSGNILLRVAASGTAGNNVTFTNALIINSTGNVGIGTSNPAGKLAVLAGTYQHLIYKAESTYQSSLRFNEENNGARFYTDAGTEEFRMQQQYASTGFLTFYTGTTERMRITSGGHTKISNTGSYEYVNASIHEVRNSAADYILYGTNPHASNPSGYYISYPSASPNNTSNYFIACADSSAARFRVASNGNCYNVTGTYTSGVSDIRYKEQIVDANSQWNDIKSLRVVNFKFIKDVEENGENALRQIGFIAQEVEEVSPNLVDEMYDEKTGESWKTIKASIIHLKAVKALQEAMARIEQLEAKVTALENK